MKNIEIHELIDAYHHFVLEESTQTVSNKAKDMMDLAIKAFNSALENEDPLKRVEMVNQVVGYMKLLTRHDAAMTDFLLAKKKMTNYSVLEQLSDPHQVSFTLQDCALLNERYRALKE